MTDRIDLDDLETGADAETEEAGNRGDWLWRDDESAEPADEFDSPSPATGGAADTIEDGPDRAPAPHVPTTGESTPVGIPTEGNGSGIDASSGTANSTADASGNGNDTESMRPMGTKPSGGSTAADGAEPASGPHGGGADEMTMAITYGALHRLEHPAAVFASASEWSDWVGIVGDVPAYVVQKFQRDRGIDVDFFNGTGTGPGERLAEIDQNSMFYAERMVVVGLEGEDEPIAEAADWEFVPLETAAAKAEWPLEDDAASE
ncbi:DUF7124 domain-containing protein [Haloterrigena alkaliphila]|uniref:DUF7124 domain-containing protein n=1 Tax=Haloterrigena alkaliphila TaxID=2816475 RepID=A0A8A2VG04_9EURY|nr:hypothetical protein [Haloterrigena alkaliphila]QSW99295.1 hypothetical protein J0X25_18290 [Haloterrigena alkaliphila]